MTLIYVGRGRRRADKPDASPLLVLGFFRRDEDSRHAATVEVTWYPTKKDMRRGRWSTELERPKGSGHRRDRLARRSPARIELVDETESAADVGPSSWEPRERMP